MNKNKTSIYLTLFFMFLFNSISFAQELITDRPDYTESPYSVSFRKVQLESGINYQRISDLSELSFPNLLTRLGLGKNLELRINIPGWSKFTNSKMFFNDIGIQLKYQFLSDDIFIPMAFLFITNFPTGADEVSVGKFEYGVKYAFAFDINKFLGLGINFGAISTTIDDKQIIISSASMSLGIGISEKVGAFFELFAEIPNKQIWQPNVDGGFTFLVTPDIQLDFYAGKGLNNNSPDFFIGSGLSVRFEY